MTEYLSYTFDDSEEFINTFDELPLWSASFGLLLLKHLELQPNLTVIDIGSGAGFPLTELAGRLGNSCKLYGLDPWVNANKRAKQKIKNYNLSNVEIIECSAEAIPFPKNSIDLIVSNLGINNFDNPQAVFSECNRVLKPNGRLVLTSNLNGHWKEFYSIFYTTLKQLGKESLIPALKQDEEHRGTVESISKLFIEHGFIISRHFEEYFEMKFLDGSAFLHHNFVKLGWLTSWLKLFPKNELEEIFTSLEHNLNEHSARNNGLILSVPMAYIEGEKIKRKETTFSNTIKKINGTEHRTKI
ncbi:MAG: methyltransferase domain-containing protein [Bacteroidetes bacterium]|nr:methyltransferase domain-containing protein [Bacteroidota bacterium]